MGRSLRSAVPRSGASRPAIRDSSPARVQRPRSPEAETRRLGHGTVRTGLQSTQPSSRERKGGHGMDCALRLPWHDVTGWQRFRNEINAIIAGRKIESKRPLGVDRAANWRTALWRDGDDRTGYRDIRITQNTAAQTRL